MLKAHVKINVIIHLENEGSSDAKEAFGAKYPLAAHHAGVIEVADIPEGERAMTMIANHVNSMFKNMSVRPVAPAVAIHIPTLEAAFGGDQEPNREPKYPEPKREHGDLPVDEEAN